MSSRRNNGPISSHQLQEDDFVDDLVGILAQADLPPEMLTVELTESSILADLYQARRQLNALEVILSLIHI